jgi:tetratricopeptide (TPR) repeat protein
MLKRIGLLIGCVLLLLLSWSAVLAMQTPSQKQVQLIELADVEITRGTYASAEPYLIQAVAYNTTYTFGALEKLKKVYLELGNTQEYVSVLKKQTSRSDCTAEIYGEFARYHIAQNKVVDALKILRQGIEQTKDSTLTDYYEEQRYAYTVSREAYEDVTAYHNGGIQVEMGELWGLADGLGKLIIPCAYEQISAYDTANNGCVVALQADRKITTLNMKNQIIAILEADIKQIGNLSQDIIPLQLANGKWIIANSKLTSNNEEYDGISTAANSAVAIKSAGKWGVATLNGKVIAPYEYDEIIMDELGKCYAQNAVFAKKDGKVYLFVNGKVQSETYEDARPFTDDGWAAVKNNGKWGFIDISGELKIDYKFANALSFSQSLAAVKLSSQEAIIPHTETTEEVEFWGYINQSGKVVMEPVFLKAKSFVSGNAPVLTDLGWQFISLLEYKKGAGLL